MRPRLSVFHRALGFPSPPALPAGVRSQICAKLLENLLRRWQGWVGVLAFFAVAIGAGLVSERLLPSPQSPWAQWMVSYAPMLVGLPFGWLAFWVIVGPGLQGGFRHELAARGRCTSCGYDLRASGGRCPECGAPASS